MILIKDAIQDPPPTPSGRKELPFTKVGKASKGQNIGNSAVDKLTFEMHIKYPTDVD